MTTSDELLKSLAQGFMPQEEMLEVAKKKAVYKLEYLKNVRYKNEESH